MENVELVIRAMTEGDLEQVMQLENRLFSNPWSRKSMLDEMKGHGAWVIEEADVILGYLCIWKVLDECQITNVATRPEAQRRGLASKLIQWMIEREYAAGSRLFFLEVRRSNEPAKRLYEKLNFIPVGIRRDYYTRPNEDAIVMLLNMSE